MRIHQARLSGFRNLCLASSVLASVLAAGFGSAANASNVNIGLQIAGLDPQPALIVVNDTVTFECVAPCGPCNFFHIGGGISGISVVPSFEIPIAQLNQGETSSPIGPAVGTGTMDIAAGDGFACTSLGQIIASDPTCGDGIIDVGETCDDGGTTPGDGCDAVCQVESGFICSGEPSVCVENPTVPSVGPLGLAAVACLMLLTAAVFGVRERVR